MIVWFCACSTPNELDTQHGSASGVKKGGAEVEKFETESQERRDLIITGKERLAGCDSRGM